MDSTPTPRDNVARTDVRICFSTLHFGVIIRLDDLTAGVLRVMVDRANERATFENC